MVKLVSFDIDGTLEVGDPPGQVAINVVRRARELGSALEGLAYVEKVEPVETNLIFFKLTDAIKEREFVSKLEEQGVLAISLSPQSIRMAIHLDVEDEMVARTISVLEGLP